MKHWLLALALLSLRCWAVPVTPIVSPHMIFNNAAGTACWGCSLYTYAAGTTTPQPTYTDSTGTSQNTNPIILGTDGGANIWLGANAYKFVLIDTLGNTVFSVDNVTSTFPSTENCPAGGGTAGAVLGDAGTAGNCTDLPADYSHSFTGLWDFSAPTVFSTTNPIPIPFLTYSSNNIYASMVCYLTQSALTNDTGANFLGSSCENFNTAYQLPGYYYGGGNVYNTSILTLNGYDYTDAIRAAIGVSYFQHGAGDSNWIDLQLQVANAYMFGSDQGDTLFQVLRAEQGFGGSAYTNTVATGGGGMGATTITFTTSSPCDGCISVGQHRPLIDTTTGVVSTVLSGFGTFTINSGTSPSTTVASAVSSAGTTASVIGTLSGPVVANRITNNTTGKLSATTATVTMNLATCPTTSTQLRVMGPNAGEVDWIQPTVVTGSAGACVVTALFYYPHSTGTTVFSGGTTGFLEETNYTFNYYGTHRYLFEVYGAGAGNVVYFGNSFGGGGGISGGNVQYVPTGTVNTGGTAVSYTSGTPFPQWLQGRNILINGTSYAVATWNSSTSLTLGSSAGTQTGVSYAGVQPANIYQGGEIVGMINSSTGQPDGGKLTIYANQAAWLNGDTGEVANYIASSYDDSFIVEHIADPWAELVGYYHEIDGLGGILQQNNTEFQIVNPTSNGYYINGGGFGYARSLGIVQGIWGCGWCFDTWTVVDGGGGIVGVQRGALIGVGQFANGTQFGTGTIFGFPDGAGVNFTTSSSDITLYDFSVGGQTDRTKNTIYSINYNNYQNHMGFDCISPFQYVSFGTQRFTGSNMGNCTGSGGGPLVGYDALVSLGGVTASIDGYRFGNPYSEDTGLYRISAGVVGVGNGTPGNESGTLIAANGSFSTFTPEIIYSAATTPVPTCTSGLKGVSLVVSDATTPTYLGTYTSGGSAVAPVVCNGTTWQTH